MNSEEGMIMAEQATYAVNKPSDRQNATNEEPGLMVYQEATRDVDY